MCSSDLHQNQGGPQISPPTAFMWRRPTPPRGTLQWAKVFKPRGLLRNTLWVVGVVMLAVCGAATVAAFRGIILNWSTYRVSGVGWVGLAAHGRFLGRDLRLGSCPPFERLTSHRWP